MAQVWRDLLFAHWPVSPRLLAPLVPEALEIDEFEGNAWVGVVPFRMTGIRPRFGFPLPWLSSFAELNLRTYVRPRNQPQSPAGVFFWSLDAANPIAVEFARAVFHLPYCHARMKVEEAGSAIHYTSHRHHRGLPAARLEARYGPAGPHRKTPLSLWLTERYCLYTTSPSGQLYRGDIHHEPWPLEEAFADFTLNTIASSAGIALPEQPPLLHFARALEVLIWPLRKA